MNQREWEPIRTDLFDEWADGVAHVTVEDRVAYFDYLRTLFCLACGQNKPACTCVVTGGTPPA